MRFTQSMKTNQKTLELYLEWRLVPGYEKYYMVSEDGRVISLPRECPIHNNSKMLRRQKELKVYKHPSGYNVVTLIIDKKKETTSDS